MKNKTLKNGSMKSSKLLLSGVVALFITALGAAGQGTFSVSAVGDGGPPAPPESLFSDPPPPPGIGDTIGITAGSPDVVTAVPEPSPEILLAVGGVAMFAMRQFRGRQRRN